MKSVAVCLVVGAVLLAACNGGTRAPAVEREVADTLGRQQAMLANELFRAGEQDSALRIADKLLEEGGAHARITAWILRGRDAQDAARFKEALNAYGEALALARSVGDDLSESRALNQLGNVYVKLGDHEAALRSALENLRLKERLADTAGVARAQHNLAIMYYEQGDLPAAEEALKASLAVKEQLGDSLGIDNGLAVLCLLAIDAGKPEEAVAHMERSLGILARNFPHRDPVPALVNLGLAHDAAGRPQEALRQYQLALAALEEHPNDAHRAVLMANMGQLHMDAGRHAQAGPYLQESLALARSVGSLLEERAALGALLQHYKATARYREAMETGEALGAVNDSLLNSEKVRSMNELRVRYDSERAELENERLQHANALAEVRMERQRWVILAIVVCVVLLALLAIVLVRNWQRRTKARMQELEHQALRAQMDPHFLFNALSSIPGLYYEHGPERATDYVGHLGQLLRLILDSSAERWVPIQSELDLVAHYFEVMQSRYPQRFTWKVRVDADIDVQRTGMPPMLLQPLVENALLHGVLQRASEGHVEVHLSTAVNGLRCRVSDNGPGLATLPQLEGVGRPSGLRITHERIRSVNGRQGGALRMGNRNGSGNEQGAEVHFIIRTEDLWA
ncbi:MAG: tetratricopeptide repeat protein [Flavobacteriales bacterium]|nr:tetratricopeptide repeat protein [Flavobacteriales bacterium]